MLASGWSTEISWRGFAVGQLSDWLGFTGYDGVRTRLLVAARRRPAAGVYFRKDLAAEKAAHGELAAALKRIAVAALAPFTLPPGYREKAVTGVTFLRDYAPGTGLFANVERWHQDGGYVQVVAALDGEGPVLWQGWTRRLYRLRPGEFAVYFASDLAEPLGLPVPFLRLPRAKGPRADAVFRSPWLFGE